MKLLKKFWLCLAVFFFFAIPGRSKNEDKNIVTRVNTIRKLIKTKTPVNLKNTYEADASHFHTKWVNWGNWGNWNNWNNWNNWRDWSKWGDWGNWGNWSNY